MCGFANDDIINKLLMNTNDQETKKLIANFMGLERRYESTEQIFIESVKYDTSWDALMPVVRKIGNIMNEFEKKPFYELDEAREILMKLGDCLCQVDILNANEAVVEFIKWYNSQAEYKR